MDYSSLTEAQQQQYQQYQQHEQQQYHQQQPQPYDAAAYDAYYAYHHQPPPYDAAAYHHQYYPQDYSAASYQHTQPAAPPAAAAAASAPQLPSHASAPHDSSQIQTQQPYPGAAAASQEQQGPSYQAPQGLNPAAAAAVAALSQLTQFAGTMDAAERAMAGAQDREWHAKGGGMMGPMVGGHPPPQNMYQHPHHPMPHGAAPIRPAVGDRSPYRGGFRRGGGPFRGGGGGRGNFGQRPPRQDGAPPPFRGRGKGRMGRGGGRRPHQSVPETQSPRTVPPPFAESSSVPEPGNALAPVSAPVLPRPPRLPVAWCDICRADCNSFEILEQHKNGKRHKKTVQRIEEIQAQQRLLAERQARFPVKPEIALPRVEKKNAGQVGEQNKNPISENTATPVPTIESKVETEIQSQIVEGESGPPAKSETAMEVTADEMPPSDAPAAVAPPTEGRDVRRPMMDDWRDGPKRKMVRFGRGGKRLRFEPVERPREQPRCCTLCNVMCDTLAVFQCHLTGKKHLSKIRRYLVRGAVYGPVTVYIPPNQPTAAQGPEPLFFGLKSQEILQQEASGLNSLQAGSFGPQRGDQAMEAEGAAVEVQAEQGSDHPKGVEVLPATEGQGAVAMDHECQNAVTEFGEKEATSAIAADAVPLPEIRGSFGDKVVLPGLDIKVEEDGADNKEAGTDNKEAGANSEELGSGGAAALE